MSRIARLTTIDFGSGIATPGQAITVEAAMD